MKDLELLKLKYKNLRTYRGDSEQKLRNNPDDLALIDSVAAFTVMVNDTGRRLGTALFNEFVFALEKEFEQSKEKESTEGSK